MRSWPPRARTHPPQMPTNASDFYDEDGNDLGDVRLPMEAHGRYRLESTDLYEADELSDEGEFPEYGAFFPVVVLAMDGTERDEGWLSAPRGLVEAMSDAGVLEPDAEFVISHAAKDREGQWVFEVETRGDDA